MNWIDDLTGASGQERRQWLAEKGDALSEKLNYYLGPAAAPVNALAQGAAMISPGADFVDMLQSGNELMGSRTARDAGMAGLGLGAATLGMAIPGTAKGVGEAVEGATKGIRAYHGSPHDFDAFDTSKIGTGEGAQAYGHGLYFAEAEDVARSYQDKLSKKDGAIRVLNRYRDGLIDNSHLIHERFAAARVRENDGDIAAAIRQIEGDQAKNPNDKIIDDALAFLTAPGNSFEFLGKNPGRMYEVNINADPADFLDWDAPLSAQSEKVRGALEPRLGDPASVVAAREKAFSDFDAGKISRDERNRLLEKLDAPFTPDMPGSSMYAKLAGTGEQNTAPLREAGIPGIKYLDAGSRGAGDGSRNYVVFDPATIEILRKYGLLGAVGGGMGANALAGGQPDEL